MKTLLIAVCCTSLTAGLLAQEPVPTPKETKPEAAKAEPKKDEVKVSKEAEELIRSLAAKLVDKDEVVRRLSEGALLGAGKASLPELNRLATGTDKVLGEAAKNLALRIERQAERRPATMADRVKDLSKEMNLDEKKSKKLEEVSKATQDRMQELMDAMRNGEMGRDELRVAMQEAREEATADLKKNGFSEEEIKKVEQSLMQSFGRFNRGGAGGGAGGGEGGGGGGGGGPGGGRRRMGGGGGGG